MGRHTNATRIQFLAPLQGRSIVARRGRIGFDPLPTANGQAPPKGDGRWRFDPSDGRKKFFEYGVAASVTEVQFLGTPPFAISSVGRASS